MVFYFILFVTFLSFLPSFWIKWFKHNRTYSRNVKNSTSTSTRTCIQEVFPFHIYSYLFYITILVFMNIYSKHLNKYATLHYRNGVCKTILLFWRIVLYLERQAFSHQSNQIAIYSSLSFTKRQLLKKTKKIEEVFYMNWRWTIKVMIVSAQIERFWVVLFSGQFLILFMKTILFVIFMD